MAGQGACPECGHGLDANANFCSRCGTRVATEHTRETRKTVTAVFADLVGSTALQERIDAERAHRVMARFYATMRDVLESQGGHVAKFIGDAVVGLFGFPGLREDDALRAVRAAAAMRDALASLNRELHDTWGVRIGMRVGVNTGEVVISPEGLAIGDTMNVAARLEQNAPDGEVLIGAGTWRHVRHAVRCAEIPPLTVKGKSGPLIAFRLLDAPAGATERVRIEASLVGRDGELRRLVEAFDAAVGAKACRLVSVIGSPGIGKTRLAEELAAAVGDRAVVVQGRCEPTGEGITFLPVVEVLHGAAGIDENDRPEVVRDKLGDLLPGDPDRELLVERAVGILGLAPPASAQETFWSVRRLLGGLARRRPLVVVLDDVHWGEPTFLDLVEHLAEWGREAPILLLALARPELRDLRPTLTTRGHFAHDVIEVSPLGDEHSRLLVDELLDRAEVPEGLTRRVLSTTEGNPLFLGEMVRMLVDDGVLRRAGDGWVTADDADAVEVPPTISALLAARIDRLGPDERTVVERAAVIGKQFYRGAVASLAPAPVAAGIDAHLEALHRKEVVAPEGTFWADEAVFRFHHVLIRDAAYRTLLKEARAELHERFADWLETKVGDLVGEHEEVIAFHLEQAHAYRRELGPLDAHGRALGRQAVTRLHATGRRALAREDLPAAVNLLRRAAAVAGSDVDGALLVDLLEALLSAGDTEDVGALVEWLREISGGDRRLSGWAVVLDVQLAQLTDTARLGEMLGAVRSAAEDLAATGDDRGLAKAHHVHALGLALLGRVGDVEEALEHALAAARRAGDTRRVTAVLAGGPRAALWGPSPVMRASGRCLDVVRILRMSQGNRYVEAVALRCQAVLEAMRGRTDAARQILQRCRTTLEELGLGMELLETDQYAGIVELIDRDFAAAEGPLRSAYEGFAARELHVGAATAAAMLARALLEQGRDGEAEELTRYSEQYAGEHLKPTITWCAVRAQVLARRGAFAEAERFARRAVDLAAATDALVDHGDARMVLADVLRAAGRPAEALAEARHAAELYTAKGYDVGVIRATGFAGLPGVVAAPELRAEGLHGTPVERAGRRWLDAFNRRDWPAFRAAVTDDVVVLDGRRVSPRGDSHGADQFIEHAQAYVALARDARMTWSQLVDVGDAGLGHVTFSGHDSETGSQFEVPFLTVVRVLDGRLDRADHMDPDDEPAAVGRLLEHAPDLVTRAAWRYQLDVMTAVNSGDAAGLDALLPLEVVDHRSGTPLDRPGLVDRLLGCDRMNLEILDTAGDQAGVSRVHLVGEGGCVFGQVTSFGDGIAVRVELFDPNDEAGMRSCFERVALQDASGAELAIPRPVLKTAFQQRWDDIVSAINRRDWTVVAHAVAPETRAIDRRALSTWDAVTGRDELIRTVQATPAVAGDAVGSIVQFAGDDCICATHAEWTGHLDDGGGAFTLEYVLLARMGQEGIETFEFFEPNDHAGAAQRLLELQPDPDTRTAWAAQLDVVYALNARNWPRLRSCFRLDAAVADHRGTAHGPESAIDLARSLLDGIPDGRVAIHFLDARRDAAMSRLHVYGSDTEIAVGATMALHHGKIARLELYDHDDDAAMRDRIAHLAVRSPAPVRPRPVLDTGFQRNFDELSAGVNRGDWTVAERCISPGVHAIDHRQFAVFGEFTNRDEFIRYAQGTSALAADAVCSFAGLAGDDHIGMAHAGWAGHQDDGGAAFSLDWITVGVLGEDGFEHMVYLDADDETGAVPHLLAYQPDPQVRAAWKLQLDVLLAINARDWQGLAGCFAQDAVVVDHGALGGMPTTPSWSIRSLLDGMPGGRAAIHFLDAGRDAAMSRLHIYDDEREFAVDLVIRLRYGKIARLELFEPEEDSARARYDEVLSVAGDGSHPETVGAQVRAVMASAYNRHDWDTVRSCLHEDLVSLNRRAVPVHGDLRGLDAFMARAHGWDSVVDDRRCVLDERVDLGDVATFSWRMQGHANEGGGPVEFALVAVTELRDGRLARFEVFDPNDGPGPLRRLAELAAETGHDESIVLTLRAMAACYQGEGDVRLSTILADQDAHIVRLGSTPQVCALEVCSAERDQIVVLTFHEQHLEHVESFEPEERPVALTALARPRTEQLAPATRVVQRFIDRVNADDLDGMRECYAEEFLHRDHRSGSVAEGFSRADFVRAAREMKDLSSDARVAEVDHLGEVDGVTVGRWARVGHLDESGGDYEIPTRCVCVIRNEAITRMETFDGADEVGAVRAWCRLVGGGDGGPGPATKLWLRFCDALARRNWDAVQSVVAPENRVVDHRRMSLPDEAGDLMERVRAAWTVTQDLTVTVEQLAEIDGIAMLINTYRGHLDEGGGEWDLRTRAVVVARNGRITRYETFEEDDEAGMLAAVARLRAERNPIAVLHAKHQDAFNARDWAAMRSMWAEDITVVDHRPATEWPVLRGCDELDAFIGSQLTISPDLEVTFEFVEGDGECAIMHYAVTGHAADAFGGGKLEHAATQIVLADGDLVSRVENYPSDADLQILRARCAELRPLARLGGRNQIAKFYERFCAGFQARDWSMAVSHWADDIVIASRRPADGWPDLTGRSEAEPFVRSLLTISPDLDHSYEIVEADEECGIVRFVARGHATETDGAGALEIADMQIAVTRGDRLGHVEIHPVEVGIDALRARRDALRPLARRRVGSGLPVEPTESEHALLRLCLALDAADWASVTAMLDPSFVLADHRPLSVHRAERDGFVAGLRSLHESLSGLTRHYEVIAASDAAVAMVLVVRGHLVDGGGPFEVALGSIAELRETGWVRMEYFDAGDEARMGERFADIAGLG